MLKINYDENFLRVLKYYFLNYEFLKITVTINYLSIK